MSILKRSMEVISTGIGIVEFVNAIIKFVGQFLSRRERQYFKLVQSGPTMEERMEAANQLTSCLLSNRGKRTVTRRLGIGS